MRSGSEPYLTGHCKRFNFHICHLQDIVLIQSGPPIEKNHAICGRVVFGFDGGVSLQPADPGAWLTHVQAEQGASRGSIGVWGALHGDFTALAGIPRPAYTGFKVTEFRSDAAEGAWNAILQLWEHANPASNNDSFMQE